jgi:outer membrane biosynthesis protein TonB
MWDVEAAGAVALARERGDAVTVLPPKEVLRWRRATEPVIAAWVKQMKERRIDGDKLLADIRELLEKYAGEPEPQPQPPPRPSPQPAPEQKVVAQPQPRPEAKVEPPKAAAPAPAPAATPAAKPPPAAASRPKELDIPL